MHKLETVGTLRKTIVLFFIVDTSAKMMGSKIGEANSAIEELIPELKDLSESNADAQIKIAVLEFSSGARWLTPNGPIEVENFIWNDMDASGDVDIGAAFDALNEKLASSAFMASPENSFAPAIFLLLNDKPTDQYKKPLYALKQNNWFKKAIKWGIAIGSDADKGVLEEFTGTFEAVFESHPSVMLRKMIKFIPVTEDEINP
jgi:uncharacterized protein YegL